MTKFSAASRILTGIVILIGILTLVGWALNVRALMTVFPGLVTMKVNTAIGFVLLGTSLLLQNDASEYQRVRRGLGKACASAVVLIAGLTLGEWVSGHDLGIDQLFVPGGSEPVGFFVPGRMSPVTATCLFLLGGALMLFSWKTSGNRFPAQYLTLAAMSLAFLAFVGYFFGVQGLYGVAPLASIALHSVVAFLLLCTAIFLARPEWELIRLLRSAGSGGMLARRMLLPALSVPLILGGLVVAAERTGLISVDFGLALFSVSLIGVFGFLIIWAAGALNDLDAERQRGVDNLRDTAARLDGIISSAMDAIISLDDQQRIVMFNGAAESIFGLRAADAVGLPITRFIPNPLPNVRNGIHQEHEGRLGVLSACRASGEEFPIEASISDVTVSGKRIFVVILRDISERQLAETALRASEERLRLFIEHAPAAVAMFDQDMHYIATSNRWLADFGLVGREVVGRSHYELFSDIPQRWKEIHQRCLSGAIERADEDLFARADGTNQWIRWEVRPWHSGADRVGGIIIMSEDITQRKETEQALRESEEQFRTMADAIPQLVWIADADGAIVWFNRRWYEYTGTDPEEMEGWGWQSVHDPQALPKVLETWKSAIAAGQPLEIELSLRGADGRFRPFLTRVLPFKDKNGNVLRWFGTNTDITDIVEARESLARSRSELERLVRERTAQLVDANANLQAFAYSAAHDLRSPLRSITGYSDIALEDFGPQLGEEGRSLLQRITECAQHMGRLLDDLLEYSRMSGAELRLENVSLERVVSDALGLLESDLKGRRAEVELAKPLPQVIGHPATITLMISNLVSNAVKFMPPGVRPRIHLRAGDGKTAGFVRFWVEDNGIGIAPAEKEKLFNAFQRLHGKQYPGTGLGLAMVRKGAERMGGQVGVESELGTGSRFWLEFRKASDAEPLKAEGS